VSELVYLGLPNCVSCQPPFIRLSSAGHPNRFGGYVRVGRVKFLQKSFWGLGLLANLKLENHLSKTVLDSWAWLDATEGG